MLDLGVGGQQTLRMQTLEAATGPDGAPSGNPRFRLDTWDVTRGPDEDDLRTFEAQVKGNGGRWLLVLALDNSGLLRVERQNDLRRFTASRQ